jgi:hypothetical protein
MLKLVYFSIQIIIGELNGELTESICLKKYYLLAKAARFFLKTNHTEIMKLLIHYDNLMDIYPTVTNFLLLTTM